MPSVLVTGAGGFIGRRVVSAVSHAGYRVAGIVRQTTSLAGASTVIQHDLRNPLNGPPSADWVFHLAGGYAGAGKKELERTDAQTAHNVIDWGFAAGIKNWIFASAAEVYGDVCGVATEEAPQRPVIPYGWLKLTVECLFAERLKTLSKSQDRHSKDRRSLWPRRATNPRTDRAAETRAVPVAWVGACPIEFRARRRRGSSLSVCRPHGSNGYFGL